MVVWIITMLYTYLGYLNLCNMLSFDWSHLIGHLLVVTGEQTTSNFDAVIIH